MALLTKRILLYSLMLLVNACVYYPHPFYGGGYGGPNYYGGHRNHHDHHYRGDGHHRQGGYDYHGRRHH